MIRHAHDRHNTTTYIITRHFLGSYWAALIGLQSDELIVSRDHSKSTPQVNAEVLTEFGLCSASNATFISRILEWRQSGVAL